MKLLQKQGMTKEELQSFKYIVFANVVTQMKVLVNATQKLDIQIESEANRVRHDQLFLALIIVFRNGQKGLQQFRLEVIHGVLILQKI